MTETNECFLMMIKELEIDISMEELEIISEMIECGVEVDNLVLMFDEIRNEYE